MQHDPKGQPAVTTWKVLGRCAPLPTPRTSPASGGGERARPGGSSPTLKELTWLALEPLTGRTHQLRVHCAAMGWPIVGDAIYGSAPRSGGPGLQLHAREVVVPLYKNREPIKVTAPVPEHLRQQLAACGWVEAAEPIAAAATTQ